MKIFTVKTAQAFVLFHSFQVPLYSLISYFWENILCTDKTKVELFGRDEFCYIWCKTSTAFYKKNTIPTVKHFGGSMIVWA